MSATTQPIAAQSIQLPGRVRLSYVEQGDPAGVPMVLLHGLTDSWHSFQHVLPLLPTSLHTFALSQRGHGDSERPAAGYRPRGLAADLAAFLDARGLERAIVVGHSLGSIIAQRFAIDAPERMLGLVLIDAPATLGDNPAIIELWEVISALTDPIDEAFARAWQESNLALPIPPVFLDTAVRETLKVPARVWKAALSGVLQDELSGERGRITAPTLLLWGEDDSFVPRGHQDALLAEIAGSRLVAYPGGGHALHWEQPERVAADLVAFAESLGR